MGEIRSASSKARGGRRAAPRAMRLGLLVAAVSLAALGPLAANAAAGTGYQENLTVDSSQPAGTSTTARLAADTTYDLSVSGTYMYGDSSDIADAVCSTPNGLTWSRDRFGATALHLLVDGQIVDWTPSANLAGCDSIDHAYTASYTPTADGVVSFAVAVGPGDQADYHGTLEVVVSGEGVATPPPAGSKTNPSGDQASTPDSTVSDVAQNAVTPPGANAPTASAPAVPSRAPATPSGGNGVQALADFMLSDQRTATGRPDHQVVLETARPRGNGVQAPSPLVLLPLLLAAVVLFKPGQTMAFATDLVRRLPAPGHLSSTTSTPWRAVVESTPPQVPSPLERPVFAVRAPQPTTKVRLRRRHW